MTWQLFVTPTAEALLGDIRDRRIREAIRARIDGLTEDPDKQGTPLIGELAGYRSLRAVGQRYRIIYRLEEQRVAVVVVAVGIRREDSKADVYSLARRLLRLRLLEGPED